MEIVVVRFPRYLIVQLDDTQEPFGKATIVGHCEEHTDVRPSPLFRVWLDDSPVAVRVGDRVEFGYRHMRRLTCAA